MYKLLLVIFISISLLACSPKFDWREVQGKQAPYKVLMPGKPSEISRDILLGADKVTMLMTVTQIDGVSFAVGAAKMDDATKAMQALATIKTGLLRNLDGKIIHEANAGLNQADGKLVVNNTFSAISKSTPATAMSARLTANGDWVFQILVVGPEKEINQDAVDTFLTSFRSTGL